MPDIVEYSARWYVVKRMGVIRVKDSEGQMHDLEFENSADFTAALTVLESTGDAWLGDHKGERILSSGKVDD